MKDVSMTKAPEAKKSDVKAEVMPKAKGSTMDSEAPGVKKKDQAAYDFDKGTKPVMTHD